MSVFSFVTDYLRKRRLERERSALEALKARYHAFRIFLENNGRALELLVAVDGLAGRGDRDDLHAAAEELLAVTGELVDGLNLLSGEAHVGLYSLHGTMSEVVGGLLDDLAATPGQAPYCVALDDLEPGGFAQAGTKAGRLAELRRMALPVPDGFVCTTRACRDFLENADLDTIRALLRDAEHERVDVAEAADRIRALILAAPLPDGLRADLDAAYEALARRKGVVGSDTDGPAISVRSSGVAEDRPDHSFAGQFTSILNVAGKTALHDAYRRVVASGFGARAIAYRLNAGLSPLDFDLAALCQCMAPARSAGVLLTRDPSRPESGRMLLSAAPGLGTLAVGGEAPVDMYAPWRTDALARAAAPEKRPGGPSGGTTNERSEEASKAVPSDVSGNILVGVAAAPSASGRFLDGATIARKTFREIPDERGGLRREAVPDAEAAEPLLSLETLRELVRYGEMIENLEGRAQDVEWAVSPEGIIAILQTRPLRLAAGSGRRVHLPPAAEPLVTGVSASPGKAVGRVRIAHSTADLARPKRRDVRASGATAESGAGSPRTTADQPWRDSNGDAAADEAPYILVLPQSLVDAARGMREHAGIIVDAGNPTDHLSCIAREYGVPMITAARIASERLRESQWIILDADEGLVSEAPESLWAAASAAHAARRPASSDEPGNGETQTTETTAGHAPHAGNGSPVRAELRDRIVPLNLTDAYGPTFSLLECRTLHDLVRYAHEMAVLAMFNAGDEVMEEAGGLLRPLDIGVPFHFLVVDVGGGTRRDEPAGRRRKRFAIRRPLRRADILSAPLAALCDGLTTPGLSWHTGPDAEAVGDIMSRTMLDSRGPRPAGSFNYALAARDYLNLNARVEFHFAMLDAVCGGDAQANYIRFRFKGGGAGQERGRRRVRFLRTVLERNGFVTTMTGDLITASLAGASREVIRERLVMLGRLLGYSRFLDGVMTGDDTPARLAEAFLAGRYDREEADGENGRGKVGNAAQA